MYNVLCVNLDVTPHTFPLNKRSASIVLGIQKCLKCQPSITTTTRKSTKQFLKCLMIGSQDFRITDLEGEKMR